MSIKQESDITRDRDRVCPGPLMGANHCARMKSLARGQDQLSFLLEKRAKHTHMKFQQHYSQHKAYGTLLLLLLLRIILCTHTPV
jgi:hypothetical protein